LSARFSLIAFALLLVASAALADSSGPSATPKVPGNTVPVWVFYWVLGLATAAAVVWSAITKILWDRGNRAQDKVSALSEEERHQLAQLYNWHNQKDDDQVPLWYTPRSWITLVQRLHADHSEVQALLKKLLEQNELVITDLREQLRESRIAQAQQQTKMVKLAVRVNRAVEALAGLQPPDVEYDLDDSGDNEDGL